MKFPLLFLGVLFHAALSAQVNDLFSVQVFQDGNFGGGSQFFKPKSPTEPATYHASKGELNGIGDNQLTGLIVPFGLCVDIFENDPDAFAGVKLPGIFKNVTKSGGESRHYDAGRYPFVDKDFNDKTSMITVYPWTDIYLSTDDDIVPSKINLEGASYSPTSSDGKTLGFGGIFEVVDDKTKFHKTVVYNIPPGYTAKVWEATANGKDQGKCGWTQKLEGQKLSVDVWVTVRSTAGPRNWIGVRASIVPL